MTPQHLMAMTYNIFLALNIMLYIGLSMNIIRLRRQYKIAYQPTKTIRAFDCAQSAQRNFFEYTVIFYIAAQPILHTLSPMNLIVLFAIYFLGRLSHAFGVLVLEQQKKPNLKARQLGIITSVGCLIFCVIKLILTAV